MAIQQQIFCVNCMYSHYTVLKDKKLKWAMLLYSLFVLRNKEVYRDLLYNWTVYNAINPKA